MLYGEPEDEELAAEEQAASLRVSEQVLLRDDGTKLFSINPSAKTTHNLFPPLLSSVFPSIIQTQAWEKTYQAERTWEGGDRLFLFHFSRPMPEPINHTHGCTLSYLSRANKRTSRADGPGLRSRGRRDWATARGDWRQGLQGETQEDRAGRGELSSSQGDDSILVRSARSFASGERRGHEALEAGCHLGADVSVLSRVLFPESPQSARPRGDPQRHRRAVNRLVPTVSRKSYFSSIAKTTTR